MCSGGRTAFIDLAPLRQETTQLPQPMHFSGSTEDRSFPVAGSLIIRTAPNWHLVRQTCRLCRFAGRRSFETALGDPVGELMFFLGGHVDHGRAATDVTITNQLIDLALVEGCVNHGVGVGLLQDLKSLLGGDFFAGPRLMLYWAVRPTFDAHLEGDPALPFPVFPFTGALEQGQCFLLANDLAHIFGGQDPGDVGNRLPPGDNPEAGGLPGSHRS